MAQTGTVKIIIDAQDRASKELTNINNKLKQNKAAFQKMAGYGAIAMAGISAGIYKTIGAAGDAEVIQGRYNAIFKNIQGYTDDWVKDMANKYGRAQSTMQATASAIGGQLSMVAKSLPEKEMSDMTKELSEQAIAMAAYYPNLETAEEAGNALSSALAGQTQRLTEMGYNLSEPTLKQIAFNEGITESERALTREEKALAIRAALLEQNSMVVEAYNENQNSYNEKMQIAKEQIKKVSENLGRAFLPMIKEALIVITPIVEKMANWISENKELVKWISLITLGIAGLVAVAGAIGLILPVVAAGFAVIFSPITLIIAAVAALVLGIILLIKHWDEVVAYAKKIWPKITAYISKALKAGSDAVENFIKMASDFFQSGFDYIFGLIGDFFGNMGDTFKKGFDFVLKLVNDYFSAIIFVWVELPRRMMKIGVDVVWGLIKGIGQTISQAVNKGKELAASVVNGVKGVLGIHSPSAVFKGIGEETVNGLVMGINNMSDKAKKTMNNLSEGLGTNYRDALVGYNEDISQSFKEVTENIIKLEKEMNNLMVENAKEQLDWKFKVADAYVEQEQKVAGLEKQMANETDEVKRAKLQQELERQRQVLEEKKQLETVYGTQINEVRRRNSLTDFERQMEDLNRSFMVMDKEFQEKKKKLGKELEMEKQKQEILTQINETAVKENEKFLAQMETATVKSVNNQIQYYNQLAKAIAKAKRGQTSREISAAGGVYEKATQKINRPENYTINVNGPISSKDDAEEVGDTIMQKLNFNMRNY